MSVGKKSRPGVVRVVKKCSKFRTLSRLRPPPKQYLVQKFKVKVEPKSRNGAVTNNFLLKLPFPAQLKAQKSKTFVWKFYKNVTWVDEGKKEKYSAKPTV